MYLSFPKARSLALWTGQMTDLEARNRIIFVSFFGYLRERTSLSVLGSRRNWKKTRGADSNLEEKIALWHTPGQFWQWENCSYLTKPVVFCCTLLRPWWNLSEVSDQSKLNVKSVKCETTAQDKLRSCETGRNFAFSCRDSYFSPLSLQKKRKRLLSGWVIRRFV